MATIVQGNGDEYLFTFSLPETDWIKELADSMGITKEAIVAAAMNKGLTHYVETFTNTTVVDKILDQMEYEIKPPGEG